MTITEFLDPGRWLSPAGGRFTSSSASGSRQA